MAKWVKTVDIKQFLTDEKGYEGIVSISNNIANKFIKEFPDYFVSDIDHYDYDYQFVNVILNMKDLTVNSFILELDCVQDHYDRCISAVELFNVWLNIIYDWADENRIWLGL